MLNDYSLSSTSYNVLSAQDFENNNEIDDNLLQENVISLADIMKIETKQIKN